MKRCIPSPILLKVFAYLTLTGIVPLILFGIISYSVSRQAMSQSIRDLTRMTMSAKMNYLELVMDEVESLMANVAGHDDITAVLKEDREEKSPFKKLSTQAKIGYILSGYLNLRGLVSIDIFSMSGAHYHVGDTLNVENTRLERKDSLFEAARASSCPVLWAGIEENVNAHSTHPRVITAVRILKTMNRQNLVEEPLGILIVNYDARHFHDSFMQDTPRSQTYMVIDGYSRIVFHPDRTLIGSAVNPDFTADLLKQKPMIPFRNRIGDQVYSTMYGRSGKSGWILLSLTPEREIASALAGIRQNTLAIAAACFILCLIFSILLYRNIVRPVKKMTDLFRRIQDGTIRPGVRLEEASRDEIGDLVLWFNTFLHNLEEKKEIDRKLKEKQQELEELNRTLEERVREELQKNREKDALLITQSRQAAMGQMIGNIAHQWRQPLNAVGALIQLLPEAMSHGTLTSRYLDFQTRKAMDLIQFMSRTIDDFRNFFRPRKEKQLFRLQEVITGALSFLEGSFKNRGVILNLHVQDDPSLYGFPNEYAQVILNILQNALDVLIEREIEHPEVTVSASAENGKAVVVIGDNGGGIAEGHLDRVFDPYFSTKEEGKGTGIGLYMSKTIIEQSMAGTLSAHNTPDGAEFRIEVPYES